MEAKINQRIAQLHQIAPDSIGDLLQFSFVAWDEETMTCTLRCRTQSWMRNAAGTLHGGIGTAVLDQAMGFLVFCILPGEGIAPSIQLQTVFHRPLAAEGDILVKVRVMQSTLSLIHVSAEAYAQERPDRLCLSGTGIYYFKPMRLREQK